MTALRRDQVLAMAPDVAAARAAQVQAAPGRWTGTGQDASAIWGECRGSGQSPYRTCAALEDGATRCTCPSRKVPCKHAIGLLLRHADGELPPGQAPEWVTTWLASRADRAAATATRAARGQGPLADPEAARRRAEGRDRKVDAGVQELRLWLADLSRTGLAAAQAQPWSWWDQQARRMIDAQARGLASQVRKMAAIAATSGHRPDWPDRLTDQIGAAHLLCEAWTRRDRLPDRTAQALRVRIGYSTGVDEVLTKGERVTDTWAVLGHRLGDDGNLRSLQQWLYGERTQMVVTFLAFAAGAQPLGPGLPPGRRSRATLALYPGTWPARALIAEHDSHSLPLGTLPGAQSWDDTMDQVAEYLAADPWADIVPMAVRGVTVLPPERGRAAGWRLRDREGRTLPVTAGPGACWAMLAVCRGGLADVAGEWDGFSFAPQAAAPAGQAGSLLP